MLDTQLRGFLLAVREDLDPTFLFERVIGPPDPWQQELMGAHDEFILVLASRQVGKSTGIACLVWHLLAQGAFVILIAPSERQSKELFRKVLDFRAKTGSGLQALRSTQTELELINGGRLICAPSTSDTVDVRARDHHGDLVVATALALWSAVGRPSGRIEVGRLENYY